MRMHVVLGALSWIMMTAAAGHAQSAAPHGAAGQAATALDGASAAGAPDRAGPRATQPGALGPDAGTAGAIGPDAAATGEAEADGAGPGTVAPRTPPVVWRSVPDPEQPPGPALAPPPDPLTTTDPRFALPTELKSYRWQIAVADLGVLAVMSQDNFAAQFGGLLMFSFAAPTIHAVHGRGWRALASMALNVGLPLLGAANPMYVHMNREPPNDCCGFGPIKHFWYGPGLGALAAALIDVAVVSGPYRVAKAPEPGWAPQVAVTPRQVGVGVAARF